MIRLNKMTTHTFDITLPGFNETIQLSEKDIQVCGILYNKLRDGGFSYDKIRDMVENEIGNKGTSRLKCSLPKFEFFPDNNIRDMDEDITKLLNEKFNIFSIPEEKLDSRLTLDDIKKIHPKYFNYKFKNGKPKKKYISKGTMFVSAGVLALAAVVIFHIHFSKPAIY